jgi:hypothetical protein
MKFRILLSLFALLFSGIARGEEVIPKTCWIDPPPELERLGGRNDPGDNPFSMQSKEIVFRPANVNPSNYRALNISVRTVGASIGDGKVVTINPVSDAQLKEAMAEATIDTHDTRVTNTPVVKETTLAGQKSLKVYKNPSRLEFQDKSIRRRSNTWRR